MTEMSLMFSSDPLLTSLDLSSFNTANLKRAVFIFARNDSLTSLDLHSFNLSDTTETSAILSDTPMLSDLKLLPIRQSKQQRQILKIAQVTNWLPAK